MVHVSRYNRAGLRKTIGTCLSLPNAASAKAGEMAFRQRISCSTDVVSDHSSGGATAQPSQPVRGHKGRNHKAGIDNQHELVPGALAPQCGDHVGHRLTRQRAFPPCGQGQGVVLQHGTQIRLFDHPLCAHKV